MLLDTPLTRIAALKTTTASTHILLSRTILLNILASLSSIPNHAHLANCLELVGLSDIRKIVRLMTLTAMDRVEVGRVQIVNNFSNHKLPAIISQLANNTSSATGACLNYLSAGIAALASCELESTNLIVDLCTRDLLMSALGTAVPKAGFVVTRALVDILSAHGGCALADPPPTSANHKGALTLVNALSAYVLSQRTEDPCKEWAVRQMYKSLATKVGMGSAHDQINFADLSGTLPKRPAAYVDAHDHRVSTLAWSEDHNLLASSGYDGTVRLWGVKPQTKPILDAIFVFHTSRDVFGNDLQGRLIGHVKWSATGRYIAAALDNYVNVWPVGKNELHELSDDWYIDDQVEFITAMAWPRRRGEKATGEE